MIDIGTIDFRLGKWEDALADIDSVSSVICDPPYGERTHDGQRHGRHMSQDGKAMISSRGLGYAHWTPNDVSAFCSSWLPRCEGWFCAMTSDDLAPFWREQYKAHDRTAFAPLACVQKGMNVRLAGDGPSNWATWLLVARPKSLSKWGTLPGAYVGSPCDPGRATQDRWERATAGGKPLWLMRSIIRDYTRPGDLVCDPCAGGATTLIAAAIEGRRAVGAECDPETYKKAMLRIKRGYTPNMFTS